MKEQAAIAGDLITVHSHSDYRNTVVVPNQAAQDSSLSWAARGLLVFMLSMPAEWRFHEKDLISRSPMGRDHLRSIVRELEAHRYLRRTRQYGANHRTTGVLWEVWALPAAATGTPLDQQEDPLPSPSTAFPSPENPSTERIQSQPGISPSTGNPSTEAEPSTAFPSPENPSAYKNHIEQKPHNPLSSSLRSEDIPRGGTVPAARAQFLQESERTMQPSMGQDSPSAPLRSRRKRPQQPRECADTSGPSPEPSTGRRAQSKPAASLPDFAEPVRSQLEAWWKLRKQRHRAAAGATLTSRSVNALAYAHGRGVLAAFADLAAESGWLSLGFDGHRALIDRLAAEQSPNDCADHSGSCMVRPQAGRGPALRPTSRQSDAAERAIAMFANSPVPQCSPQPISSISSPG